MTTVSTYILTCQRLLHDATNQFYSQQELTDYVNEARLRVVRDTGCQRSLQSSYVTTAVERYAFGTVTGAVVLNGGSGYTNPTVVFSGGGGGSGAAASLTVTNGVITAVTVTNIGSGYTSAPTGVVTGGGGSGGLLDFGVISANTIDILNINVIWGNSRLMLDYLPFSRFNYWLRGWSLLQGRPIVFTIYGQNTFVVGPSPDQSYAVEYDTVIQPYYFSGPTDPTNDAIPVPFQSPIAYYACYLAKQRMQQWEEAEFFHSSYKRQIMSAINSAYTRRLTRVI